MRARLPEGARVGPLAWSNRGDRIACALYGPGGAELWVVEAGSGEASRATGFHLNTVLARPFEWERDDHGILCAAVPADRADPAARPGAGGAGLEPGPAGGGLEGRSAGDSALALLPAGPLLRVGAGQASPQRTARDVLRTAADQARFAWYAASQLVDVPVQVRRAPRLVGDPGMLRDWSLAPDDRHLLVSRLAEPPPLGFPHTLFARSLEVWDFPGGTRIAGVGEAPLDRRSAISSVPALGPRAPAWSPAGSLWFFAWEDRPGADLMAAVRDTTLPPPGTDRLMRLDPPFTERATPVATSDQPLDEMLFSADGRTLLLRDLYRPRRIERRWWIDPAAGGARHDLVRRSTEGVYDQPGQPLRMPGRRDPVLWTPPRGRAVYFAGDGFGPDGQRPFLDRIDLATGKKARLYECARDVLEPAQVLLSGDGRRFVTSRQSNRMVPNYFLRVAGRAAGRRLSDYADPAPALTASQRVQFKFTRPDSVALNAEVVLPADWRPGHPLPTILWVYPEDYRSAAAASQNRRSPNRFPSQSPLNPEVLVTQGYAVLYPDLAVVGTNDRYVEEIQMDAKAVLGEAVRRGFSDPQRVGVGGHSYGAFSTANLLAHTDLFRAGTASDGAYNRTLTPFTFQAEDRTLWEARDTYLKMSPFLYAEQIHAPLLLLHNLDDTNVGTHPLQSERMFEALDGLGKTVSLVEYPYEDHGPAARETVLDYWARVIEWFDRYVKGTTGTSVAAPD